MYSKKLEHIETFPKLALIVRLHPPVFSPLSARFSGVTNGGSVRGANTADVNTPSPATAIT